MEEWKEYKIGDVCRIKHGFAFKGIYFVDDQQKYVCVTPGNFALKGGFKNDKPKYYNGPIPEDYVLQKDDLVVTMTDLSKNGDTLGYSALIPYDEHYTFLHNQRIGLIEDISNEIDKHFLYWVMRTYDYQRYIVGHCSGSTVKHTSPSGIGSYIFRCPDMETQREISSILDNLDEKIEVNRKINENLEQQAQALFKSWFVDFEPFCDQPFVESEMGMIPKGWRVGTFLENIHVMPGGTPSTSVEEYWKDGRIPFFSPKDVNGIYCFETEKSITEAGLNNCSSRLYPKDTLFITARGTVGKLALAGVPMAMNQSNYALVAKEGVGKFYLYLLAQTLVSILLKKANGAVFSAITTKDFNEPNLMPTNNVMECFEELVKPIFDKIFQTCEESRRLAEIRDILLPKLMSGELKVTNMDLVNEMLEKGIR